MLAKKLHPDRLGGGNAEKFKDVTLAYRIVGELGDFFGGGGFFSS